MSGLRLKRYKAQLWPWLLGGHGHISFSDWGVSLHVAREKRVLLGALLAAFLLAAVAPSRPALADLTFLDGELTSEQAAVEVGIYCTWSSCTGREINGFDHAQSYYSDANLGRIHQWNRDFRQFNVDNGNCVNTEWVPLLNGLTDAIYTPPIGGLQYDNLYEQIQGEYIRFQQRYPDRATQEFQTNFATVSGPVRGLMAGYALSSMSVEYGDVTGVNAWTDRIIDGLSGYQVTIDNSNYYCTSNENTYKQLIDFISGNDVLTDLNFTNGYPIFLAYKNNKNNPLYAVVIAYDNFSYFEVPMLSSLTPISFVINADNNNTSIYPVRNYYCVLMVQYITMNNETYLRGATMRTFDNINSAIGQLNNYKLAFYIGNNGFTSGGGENIPSVDNQPSQYINVPSPVIVINGDNVTVNTGDTITYNGVTYENDQFEYDADKDQYKIVNTEDAQGYEVTNDRPTETVTDTNDGLGWLGGLLQMLIDALTGLLDFVRGIFDGLFSFITDFVIGDLESIDLSGLQLPDLSGVFPFSIPWDVANILQLLSAEPLAPEFDWPIPNVDGTEEVLTISLADFSPVMETVRTCEVVAFVVGLAIVTRRLLG